ncbi:hypothetical protein HanPI659440_Chr09g0359011 [Helianthus annuus]|nr:hypothetical protein HanPI659440_Chr09g0359011 [Helianthus annuus]
MADSSLFLSLKTSIAPPHLHHQHHRLHFHRHHHHHNYTVTTTTTPNDLHNRTCSSHLNPRFIASIKSASHNNLFIDSSRVPVHQFI